MLFCRFRAGSHCRFCWFRRVLNFHSFFGRDFCTWRFWFFVIFCRRHGTFLFFQLCLGRVNNHRLDRVWHAHLVRLYASRRRCRSREGARCCAQIVFFQNEGFGVLLICAQSSARFDMHNFKRARLEHHICGLHPTRHFWHLQVALLASFAFHDLAYLHRLRGNLLIGALARARNLSKVWQHHFRNVFCANLPIQFFDSLLVHEDHIHFICFRLTHFCCRLKENIFWIKGGF